MTSPIRSGGIAAHRHLSTSGAGRAFRQVRAPVLWALVPPIGAVLAVGWYYAVLRVFGFDFEGTIWEPARALLEGGSIYPPPTRAGVEIGNPAVYPPFVAIVTAPIGLLPLPIATGLWTVLLLCCVLAALRLLGVRDWRCHVLAATSVPVLDGVFWGNLTLVLLVPMALAWRYRARASIAGLAIGTVVAAKLFVWPLVVWLLMTRRYRAALWATASAVLLMVGAWAIIGFDGLADYPRLLSVLQDVYAVRSFSIATIAGGFGASVDVAVALGAVAGLSLLAVAAWLSRKPDGDRRAFVLCVMACVVASPIVWRYYGALLFVPVAVTWPRLAPAWFFGHVMALALLLPSYSLPDPEPCCRPPDLSSWIWAVSHTVPEPWQALGVMGVMAAVMTALVARPAVPHGSIAATIATARSAGC